MLIQWWAFSDSGFYPLAAYGALAIQELLMLVLVLLGILPSWAFGLNLLMFVFYITSKRKFYKKKILQKWTNMLPMSWKQAEVVHFSAFLDCEHADPVVGILWLRLLSFGSLRGLGYPGAANASPCASRHSPYLGVRTEFVNVCFLYHQQKKGITPVDKNCYVLRSTSGLHDIICKYLARQSSLDTALLQGLVEPAFYRFIL